jgi:hypothetical protein
VEASESEDELPELSIDQNAWIHDLKQSKKPTQAAPKKMKNKSQAPKNLSIDEPLKKECTCSFFHFGDVANILGSRVHVHCRNS